MPPPFVSINFTVQELTCRKNFHTPPKPTYVRNDSVDQFLILGLRHIDCDWPFYVLVDQCGRIGCMCVFWEWFCISVIYFIQLNTVIYYHICQNHSWNLCLFGKWRRNTPKSTGECTRIDSRLFHQFHNSTKFEPFFSQDFWISFKMHMHLYYTKTVLDDHSCPPNEPWWCPVAPEMSCIPIGVRRGGQGTPLDPGSPFS